VLDSTYKVILKQLELNQKIYFLDFGTFEMYERVGGDKLMGNVELGEGTILRYIPPRNRIKFVTSDALDRAINEGDFKMPNRRNSNKKTRAQIVKDYNERHKKDKPTSEELLVKALNTTKARHEKEEDEIRRLGK
jgi:nucleoid DNA-binding protein